MKDPGIILFYTIFANFVFFSNGVKITHVGIPKFGLKDGIVNMRCDYQLDPNEGLIMVKWSKDNEEFFRYQPSFSPATFTFPVQGILVDMLHSNDHKVILKNLNRKSTGKYRCQVFAAKPYGQIQSVEEESQFTIVGRKKYLVDSKPNSDIIRLW